MAVSAVVLKDTDYETVVKVTTTGTNSAASIVDASALEGADSNPRLAIVACQWTTGSQTNILFDASSNVVALSGSLTGVKVTIPSSGSSFRLAIPLMSYFFSALILPKSKLSCPISILV